MASAHPGRRVARAVAAAAFAALVLTCPQVKAAESLVDLDDVPTVLPTPTLLPTVAGIDAGLAPPGGGGTTPVVPSPPRSITRPNKSLPATGAGLPPSTTAASPRSGTSSSGSGAAGSDAPEPRAGGSDRADSKAPLGRSLATLAANAASLAKPLSIPISFAAIALVVLIIASKRPKSLTKIDEEGTWGHERSSWRL